jgi:hypothetical protein
VRARPGRPPPQWIVGRRARTHGSNNHGDYDAADRSSSGHRRAHRPTRVHPAASRRRVFLCADDAHDPFQRALEIYLRRLDTIDVRTEAAWMRVVVRNTALAVRKSRSQLVGSEDVDFDSHVDDAQRSPQKRIASAERVTPGPKRCASSSPTKRERCS